MKLRLLFVMLAAVAVLWVGLIAAAKWADRSLNDGRRPESADAIIQGVSTETSSTLPTYWDVPAFSFPDQDGKPITNRDLLGHVWVADFIFTQCTTACPIMTSKMLLLQKQVLQPSVRFVSFSVDPAHDTPAVLKKYAELWRGDPSRWILLSTKPATLAAVVKAMRITVEATADPENPITHSSLFMLRATCAGFMTASTAKRRRSWRRI
jgi:cytochrome oxidase Cu insertion factor (SCO1/SenC/PrrC family)